LWLNVWVTAHGLSEQLLASIMHSFNQTPTRCRKQDGSSLVAAGIAQLGERVFTTRQPALCIAERPHATIVRSQKRIKKSPRRSIQSISHGDPCMQFIRDVFAVSLGVFLGFVAIVNTHGMLDIVYAFSQLESLRFLADFQL
jgi:hypothetical protein